MSPSERGREEEHRERARGRTQRARERGNKTYRGKETNREHSEHTQSRIHTSLSVTNTNLFETSEVSEESPYEPQDTVGGVPDLLMRSDHLEQFSELNTQ